MVETKFVPGRLEVVPDGLSVTLDPASVSIELPAGHHKAKKGSSPSAM